MIETGLDLILLALGQAEGADRLLADQEDAAGEDPGEVLVVLLPPVGPSGDLALVCVGVYPSAEEAKRAAAKAQSFPGSASRPFA